MQAGGEDDVVPLLRQLAEDALAVGPLGHIGDDRGLDLVAQLADLLRQQLAGAGVLLQQLCEGREGRIARGLEHGNAALHPALDESDVGPPAQPAGCVARVDAG